jgi:hypothetical protein
MVGGGQKHPSHKNVFFQQKLKNPSKSSSSNGRKDFSNIFPDKRHLKNRMEALQKEIMDVSMTNDLHLCETKHQESIDTKNKQECF